MNPQPKPKRELDASYLVFVRSKPCCFHGPSSREMGLCGPTQAHHVSPRNGTKSAASKVSDRRAVPVCQSGHDSCEAHPGYFQEYLEGYIHALNAEYDQLHSAKQRETRKRKPTQNILTVVHCAACGKDHPMYYVAVYDSNVSTGISFTCKLKNQRVLVEI